jgi:hypothetical protein
VQSVVARRGGGPVSDSATLTGATRERWRLGTYTVYSSSSAAKEDGTLRLKSGVIASCLVVFALASVSAVAAGSQGTMSAKARLTVGQEVPPATVKVTDASGQFAGALTKSKRGYRLRWRLTFSQLSGKAISATIHQGRRGRHGAALITLCAPCRSGAHGGRYVSPGVLSLMKKGRTYINVRTPKNRAGEIRGQIAVAS